MVGLKRAGQSAAALKYGGGVMMWLKYAPLLSAALGQLLPVAVFAGNEQQSYPPNHVQSYVQGYPQDHQVTQNSQSTQSTQNYQNDPSATYFNRAEKAKANDLQGYEQKMAGGLFAMYPIYWRLNKQLSTLDAQEVIAFGQRYAGSVMAEKLLADFAETQAALGNYQAVALVSPYITNADASERCAIGLGMYGTGNPEVFQYKDVWLEGVSKHHLCNQLADELTNHPRARPQDLHERLLRMLRLDGRQLSKKNAPTNTRVQILTLAQKLNVPMTVQQLDAIASDPRKFFSEFNQAKYYNQPALGGYLYLYAIAQLAHESYNLALSQLQGDMTSDNARPQPLLSDVIRRYAYRIIAVKRMYSNTDDGFSPMAVQWFHSSLGLPFSDEEAQKYAQAAIYFGYWQDVVQAISEMSKAQQNEAIWQYWLARSYEQLGYGAQAAAIYQTLATALDYYGMLARDKLAQPILVQELGATVPAADRNRVMSDPHFARAFLLMQQGAEDSYISREWNWAVRQAKNRGDSRLIIHAAKLAYDVKDYRHAINAINHSGIRLANLSHPLLFRESVTASSQRVGIDSAWTYGIIRQESQFQSHAKSGANAEGLMQIIPGTAKQIARKLGERPSKMRDPATNIRYGTHYLAQLAEKFQGQAAPATAGYNAGPLASQAWLPKIAAMEADRYIEAIPYSETRDYVKAVMTNATIYGVLLGNPIPISERMGVVSPVAN